MRPYLSWLKKPPHKRMIPGSNPGGRTILHMKLPKHAKIKTLGHHVCLRLIKTEQIYYRDSGDWGIGFEFKDGKLVTKDIYSGEKPWLVGLELTEVTKNEWTECNGK